MTMHRLRTQCFDCDAADERDRATRRRVAETLRNVPDDYRNCVTDHDFEVRGIPLEKKAEVEAQLMTKKLVIMGERSGAGKSTLAAYGLRRWAEKNTVGRGLWLTAYDLAGNGYELRPEWLTVALVVLDDLGAERLISSSLVAEFLEKRKRPLWITTALDLEKAAERYSEHIARRTFDRAVPIRME